MEKVVRIPPTKYSAAVRPVNGAFHKLYKFGRTEARRETFKKLPLTVKRLQMIKRGTKMFDIMCLPACIREKPLRD